MNLKEIKELIDMLVAENYEELTEAIGEPPFEGYWEFSGRAFVSLGVEQRRKWLYPETRSMLDLILGRQDFYYGELGHEGMVTIQYGKVISSIFPTY